jgi:hypothetical protein
MQTDRHDETSSHFSQFCECAQKQQSKIWTENLKSNADKHLNNSKRALKTAFQTEHRVHITPSASVTSLPLQCRRTDINNAAQYRQINQENKPTSYITSIYTQSIEHISTQMANHQGSK